LYNSKGLRSVYTQTFISVAQLNKKEVYSHKEIGFKIISDYCDKFAFTLRMIIAYFAGESYFVTIYFYC